MKLQQVLKYWGKAKETEAGEVKDHPLILHSLDVTAVAQQWWEHSSAIRRSFRQETGFSEQQTLGWIQFFIALHDLGKLDLRFQNKLPKISPFKNIQLDTTNYDHGKSAYMWFVQESASIFKNCDNRQQRHLQNWLSHTAGHHGMIPLSAEPNPLPSYVEHEVKEQDQMVREKFVQCMLELFLKPSGIDLNNINLPEKPPVLLAGFCSVSDWLGSNTDYFKYADRKEKLNSQQDLSLWFESRKKSARQILKDMGLLTKIITSGGMNLLYSELQPRNTQTLISKLKVAPSLVIIEADTGSGKTESAIAFASCLLAKGFADGLIFALPTQATANAILPRLTAVSKKIFCAGRNVILAHGRSPYNKDFKTLIENSRKQTGAKGNEAGAQCSEWLSLSRKRAFLGQIAITTVDQVMLSAIKSLKHYFIRSFGIGKSVLIIDEIHAYDAYMYGLLKEVIRQQKQAGGSVILLSATLPEYQKQKLLKGWSGGQQDFAKNDKYPLVLQVTSGSKQGPSVLQSFTVAKKEKYKKVLIELWPNNDISIDREKWPIIERAVIEKKAKVGIICNLVDEAQSIAKKLEELKVPVDIFHSRYRYKDRMEREESVVQKYGKNSREKGRVLVGTQVLEQSLDIDFDWLITFLCPVDLLFQRMGRLHRFIKPRPENFERPLCSIILPSVDQLDYQLHEYIYHNKRALWRTQQLLYQQKEAGCVVFPPAYREWIEKVYQEEPWKEEPEEITTAFKKYDQDACASEYNARSLTSDNSFFQDTEGNASTLTREGEMNLTVIPVIETEGVRYFLDGESRVPSTTEKDKKQWEELYQNSIPVPSSWKKIIPGQPQQGIYYLKMQKTDDKKEWASDPNKGCQFYYRAEYGLQKIKT